jgi:hypothetical protein
MIWAGSPGIRWINEKTITEARRSEGIMLPIRLIMYDNMAVPSFRRKDGGKVSLSPEKKFYLNRTPQNFGQISDEAESPWSLGL